MKQILEFLVLVLLLSGIVKLALLIDTWHALRHDDVQPYRGFRYPAEVIEYVVWLYHCFSLSLREVELILAARGVAVTYESIRSWGLRFGRMFANTLKRRRPRLGDKWHMDEVFIRIQGKLHYLWRAIDQDGNVLDISSRAGAAPRRPGGSFVNCNSSDLI